MTSSISTTSVIKLICVYATLKSSSAIHITVSCRKHYHNYKLSYILQA